MKVDINSDLGEGSGADVTIMPFISSCNIACGGHAGNPISMQETIDLAIKNHVKIGAHPSYPDPANFGRKVIDMPLDELKESILSQIKELEKWTNQSGAKLHHIKPHGALYNEAAANKSIADLIVEIMKSYYPDLVLYVPDGSIIAEIAKREEISIWFEVFADRNYRDDLTLVSRKEPNAVLYDSSEVLEHLKRMIISGQVLTVSGKQLPIKADTVCVHGDNPSALKLVASIYELVRSYS